MSLIVTATVKMLVTTTASAAQVAQLGQISFAACLVMMLQRVRPFYCAIQELATEGWIIANPAVAAFHPKLTSANEE